VTRVKMRPRALAFAVGALVLGGVVGCGGGDSGSNSSSSAPVKPGELKRFDGVTINVATLGAGPDGVISGVVYKYRDEWSKLTGGKVEVAEVPYGDLHTKIMADLHSGVGKYDGLLAQAWFYGDYMAGELVKPIDEYMQADGFPKFDNDAVLPPVKNLMTWGDKQYAPPFDGDEHILWYRKDVLSDPRWQKEFKAKYGYDLPNPPKTVDELIDASIFFQGKDWNGDGKPDNGNVMSLKSGQDAAQFWYQSVSSSYAIMPGEKIDQYHNVYWFDPETLEPLINQPGQVKGLEQFVKLSLEGGPREQLSFDLGQSWDAFVKGNTVFTVNTADIASMAQTSKVVKGKLGGAPMPGSKQVWDREAGKWAEFDKPVRNGNLLGANWNGTISSLSENPEAVYSFFAFLAQKEKMVEHGYAGWDGVDPTSTFQFLPPGGDATPAGFKGAGWNAKDAKVYSDSLLANLEGPDTYIPYLRTRGTSDMLSALDAAVTNTLAGRSKPKEALDGVAESWKRTVSDIGDEEFKQEYLTSINYGKAPTGP
jgi:multiple sugar transport system substrate-binding protein